MYVALAQVLLALCCLKPIVDFFWQLKLPFFGTSFQGVIAVVVVVVSLFISLKIATDPKEQNPRRIFVVLFLILVGFVLFSQQRGTTSLEFALKYLASAAGLVFVPWAFDRASPSRLNDRFFFKLSAISVIAVLITLFLQGSELIPWQVFDLIPVSFWTDKENDNLAQVGRLTGFYYHPLDLIRVLIWPFFFSVSLMFSRKGRNSKIGFIFFFLFQATLVGTTHRMTLFFSTVAAGLLLWRYRGFIYSVRLMPVAITGWLAGVLLFSALQNANYFMLFSPAQFVKPTRVQNLIKSEPTPSVSSSKSEDDKVFTMRGRGYYWSSHMKWISTFSPLELLFGTNRPFPEKDEGLLPDEREAQPHSQIIDAIERFGVIGFLFFLVFYIFGFFSVVSGVPVSKVIGLATLGWYGLFTEVLVMPTFTWWAILFCRYFKPLKN